MDYISAHKDICRMLTRLTEAILAGRVALSEALAFGRELFEAQRYFSSQMFS